MRVNIKRKHAPLDVVNMFATLTLEHWKSVLLTACKSNNIEKCVAWRYGLQSGLSDAVGKGIKNEKLDLWVIKRCRDLEKCARFILKKKYPDPVLNLKTDPKEYIAKVKKTKQMRDRDLENYLRRSSF